MEAKPAGSTERSRTWTSRRARREIPAVVAGALAAGVLLSGGPAGATASPTFRGTCTLAGAVTFSRPITVLAGYTEQSGDFEGRCTGVLDGVWVAAAPARLIGSATSPTMSCAAGVVDGTGRLTIGDVSFPLTWHEKRIAAVAQVVYTGATWVGTGVAYVTGLDPVAAAQACLGSGISRVTVTETPVIASL